MERGKQACTEQGSPAALGSLWAQFHLMPLCPTEAPATFDVLQVNYILESRASTARADYFAQKQRKLSRRTSFSFQKEKKSGQQ